MRDCKHIIVMIVFLKTMSGKKLFKEKTKMLMVLYGWWN